LKVIILALASTEGSYGDDLTVHEKTLGSLVYPKVKMFWALGGASKVLTLKNRIYLPVDEKFTNILKKTIMSLNYLDEVYNPDIIIRTNTSSYFDLDKVIKICEELQEKKFDFAGYLETYKENTVLELPNRFVNGAGIYLSSNAIKLLKNMDCEKYNDIPDDVAITSELERSGMKPTPLKRNNMCYHHIFIPRAHIRVRSWKNQKLAHDRMLLVHQFTISESKLKKVRILIEIYMLEYRNIDFSIEKIRGYFSNLMNRRFKA
jgi:hypothetical protein